MSFLVSEKGCSAALEHLKHMVEEMDGKLIKGTPLDASEQDFYNNVSSLDDKLAYTMIATISYSFEHRPSRLGEK